MARIAIVGAGPAGASAGWHLASRGHDVVLIDRAEFPRPKTCGDWITLGAVEELEHLGLTRAEIEREASPATINETVIVAPNGRRTTNVGRAPAYCIPRFVFDALLWRHAVAAGCRPIRQAIRDVAADHTLRHDFDQVIDARGAHAGTANAVALRAYWTVPRDLVDAGEATSVHIHTDAAVRRGYGWIFPVASDHQHVRFNLGVGLWKADSVSGRNVADFYARFIATNPVLQRWHQAGGRTTEEPAVGCHVGLGLWRNVVAAGGVLRIGDAANLADPLTGDGIGNALKSGRLVAEAIGDCTTRADAERAWQARHDQTLLPELRGALMIRRALVSTAGKNTAARLLSAAPFLRRRLHAALFGETGYVDIVLGGAARQ